uniref:Major facilitator superfamily (MFS) profile domain-containing protein n=1 Tax=Bionectria ochroleuca TaxID=29856 RepID=A0A8H7N517_BIOOC
MTASVGEKSPSAWASVTPMLLFSCFCLLVGDVLFGYDTASFGGILANPGFLRQFATHNPKTDTYAFEPVYVSLLSSLAFIGKFVGCLIAGPSIERFGHRAVFVALSIISITGVIIEITAADDGEALGATHSLSLVESLSTSPLALLKSTSPLRGFVVISLQLFLNLGSIIAVGLNKAFSTYTSGLGWKIITAIQFVFPVFIIIFSFLIPHSPRWLLSKDREEEALAALKRLRPKADAEDGTCEAEIQKIRAALQEQVHKGPWIDLFRGTNLRRTMLVIVFYFYQQTTGQAFVSTYQTVFYKENGYADQAFTYPVILYCLNTLVVIPAMYLIEYMGRRNLLLASFSLQAFWMMILAGIGSKAQKTAPENNLVVASLMLFSLSYNGGGAAIPYLLGTELPNAALREKTQSLGAAWNVIWAFVTNYVIPYMIVNLKFGTGWVFGGISISALVFTFFFLPETKGLALEDIDKIFETRFNPFRRERSALADPEHRVKELTGRPILTIRERLTRTSRTTNPLQAISSA